jgi:hypothetical protein
MGDDIDRWHAYEDEHGYVRAWPDPHGHAGRRPPGTDRQRLPLMLGRQPRGKPVAAVLHRTHDHAA